ncbi:MFS transporter [Cellulomonas sp.]|uniref:MFS transporter n=1 Tax=Cellulomonas sp. TaxID=40001 RepID=UPI002D2501A4|nr:MFS transporter [Cellulomonas sp.]HYQ75383.1 MFS transporter [Cellulomonas sp.]
MPHPTAHAAPADAAPDAAPAALGPRFRALLASTTLANLADGVVQAAVPLLALTLTRSPGLIALVTAATWLPWLLLGLLGGVVVDRTDRRRVQVVALAARAALLVAAAVLVAAGGMSVPALVALVLLYGATDVLVDLAESALVPDLVPRSRLQAANGRVVAAQHVAGTFVGGPVGGLLVAVGAGWAFGLPAALAVLAALALLRGVPGRYRQARPADGDGPDARGLRGPLRDVAEGVGFLVRHPVLRPLLISGSLVNMCFTGYTAVLVLWVVGEGSRVGMPPAAYPLLGVALAVGAVAGSFAAEGAVRRVGEVRLLLGCWVAMAALLVVPVLAPHPLAIGGAFLAVGLTNSIANVLSQSMRQRLVAPSMLGRVGGAGRTLAYGLMPLGALLAGAAAERWGLAPVLLGATGLSLVALAPSLLRVRQRAVDAAEPAAPGAPTTPAPPA